MAICCCAGLYFYVLQQHLLQHSNIYTIVAYNHSQSVVPNLFHFDLIRTLNNASGPTVSICVYESQRLVTLGISLGRLQNKLISIK